MKHYLESIEEVFSAVDSSANGLTDEQAQQRLAENGKNKLDEGEKPSLFKRIIDSLSDPMIIMLLATALISAVTSALQGEAFTDVFIILFVVIINTIMGLVQESKAEEAIDALKEMTAATSKALRNGVQTVVKSEDLVVGDVLVFEAGDVVPADCRIIESYSLKAEEAALTGESVPVNKLIDTLYLTEGQKDITLGDRHNMLYSGSTVAYGRGKAVVVATGMDTEIGKIAASLQDALSDETPLQRKMAELSKTLTKLVIGICVFVFIIGIVRKGFSGEIVINTFLTAIALAVAAIPEGLPAVVTIILSIGVTAMSKRKALMRKLAAVETLGCIQVICSDKTGTLTQNKMTVEQSFTFDTPEEILARGMSLCSDSKMGPGETSATGEPTENGLVEYAARLGLPKYELDKDYPRIGEAPFDSNRKMMSTVHKQNGKIVQYTKGATEIVITHCTHYLQNGQPQPITDEIKKTILEGIKGYADEALRVLGLAMREYDAPPASYEAEDLEKDLTFVGYVGMMDPCRIEVFDAIERCRTAGIRPIMITGDHKDTAVAIAKRLHIINDADEAILGEELESLSDEEMDKVVMTHSVYARVQPEHKTRIVRALEDMNYIVAMTGDGVNDAPSIKSANVGVSMGITGTDVTKGVSDMVLADDNFATIVNAVEEGRKIYDNIRKVLQFQLSTNMAEVLAIFTSSLLGVEMLSPAHLLWINMVTDSAPGLALGMEEAEGDIMSRKPRPTDDSVFSEGAGVDMIIQGIIMATLVVASFFIGDYVECLHDGRLFSLTELIAHGSKDGMSMAFLTMNFCEMFHAVCMRSQRNSIFTLKHRNKWLLGAFVLTFVLTLGVIYIPFLANLFEFTAISALELFIACGLAAMIVPIIELSKLVQRKIAAKKN